MVKVIWDKLFDNINSNGLEVKVFTIRGVKERYFKVYVKDDYLLVDRSIDNENTCNINTTRRIIYKQFEEVHAYYDRYVVEKRELERS